MIAAKLLVGIQTDRQQPVDLALFKSFASPLMVTLMDMPRASSRMTGVAAVAVRSLRRYEPDQVLRDSAIADLSRRGAPGTA